MANPRKPVKIIKMLVKNKEKLVDYLDTFHSEKQDQQVSVTILLQST